MKFTPEVTSILIGHLKDGKERIYAVDQAGICYDTFLRWMEEGTDPQNKDKHEFAESVKKAEREGREHYKRSLLDIIIKAAKSGRWAAACWLLERRFSDEFALKTHQKISGFLERSEDDAAKAEMRKKVQKFLAEILSGRSAPVIESKRVPGAAVKDRSEAEGK